MAVIPFAQRRVTQLAALSLASAIAHAAFAEPTSQPASQPAPDPPIHDDGHFFSPAAIARATAGIGTIKAQFRKDVRVETYAAIPDALQPQFKKQGQSEFFQKWARQRVKELQLNGVILLITRQPVVLQIAADAQTSKQAVTPADQEDIRAFLIFEMRNKLYDQVLTDMVGHVQDALAHNLGAGGGSPATKPANAP
jgi:hypothetical protein